MQGRCGSRALDVSRDLRRGVSIARISMYERNPRRLRRYRCRRQSPASTSTLTLCGRRVATRTANTVRVLMLDGSSKRACMRHHSSLHVAHQLPATRAVHFPTRTAASPRGLGGFAAAYPNCGKQKKLSYVYDMRHNFAPHRISILHDLIVENARQQRLLEKGGRCRARRRKRTYLRHFDLLFGRNSRGEASLR